MDIVLYHCGEEGTALEDKALNSLSIYIPALTYGHRLLVVNTIMSQVAEVSSVGCLGSD